MTSANEQIVTAFEEAQMTPEEIAAELDYEVTAVKAILFQCSSVYRQKSKTQDDLSFTEEEEVMARRVISNIARYSDDERLKLRAAMYIRDDKKGRLDLAKAQSSLNVSVIEFNDQMKRAIAAVNKVKGIIDVEPPAELKQLTPSSTNDQG